MGYLADYICSQRLHRSRGTIFKLQVLAIPALTGRLVDLYVRRGAAHRSLAFGASWPNNDPAKGRPRIVGGTASILPSSTLRVPASFEAAMSETRHNRFRVCC